MQNLFASQIKMKQFIFTMNMKANNDCRTLSLYRTGIYHICNIVPKSPI